MQTEPKYKKGDLIRYDGGAAVILKSTRQDDGSFTYVIRTEPITFEVMEENINDQ